MGYAVARFCSYQALRAAWYSLRQCKHVTFSMCVASPDHVTFPSFTSSVLLIFRWQVVVLPAWWTMVPAGAVSAWVLMFLSVNRGRVMFLVPCGGFWSRLPLLVSGGERA